MKSLGQGRREGAGLKGTKMMRKSVGAFILWSNLTQKERSTGRVNRVLR
jgi:hypothetical protein